MSKPFFNDESNELARIGAMSSMLPRGDKRSPTESQVERMRDSMSVQERKVFTAMTDLFRGTSRSVPLSSFHRRAHEKARSAQSQDERFHRHHSRRRAELAH